MTIKKKIAFYYTTFLLVWMTGLEPATSWSQTTCSSQIDIHPVNINAGREIRTLKAMPTASKAATFTNFAMPAYLYRYWDSNPENVDFESTMYANSIIPA